MKKSTFVLVAIALTAGLVSGLIWPGVLPFSNQLAIRPGHRISLDFDTIMGGLGGVTIEVVDEDAKKGYLYVLSADSGSIENNATLFATVDLATVGREKLSVQLHTQNKPKLSDENGPSNVAEIIAASVTKSNGDSPAKSDQLGKRKIGETFELSNLKIKIAKVERMLLKSNSFLSTAPTEPSYVFTVELINSSDGKVLTPSIIMTAIDNFGNRCESQRSVTVEGNEHKKKIRPGEEAILKEHFVPSIDTATKYTCTFTLYEGESWDNQEFVFTFVPNEHVSVK